MNKPITNLKDLVEGEEYYLQSLRFNTTNKARFLGMDFHEGLNRDIGYWQFSERGYKPVNREQMINEMKSNIYNSTVFALWGFELKGKTLNTIITKKRP